MKYGIFDWAGNRLFNGQSWPSAEDAWEVVYAHARKQLGEDCSEKAYDDFVGEYCVEQVDD